MTEQEQQLIAGLGERIRNAPAPQIDRDAYDLILHTIGTRPDALYILTQTVLIQEMALNQARAQIEELKRQPAGYAGVPQQGGFLPGSYQGSSYAAPPPPIGRRLLRFSAQCRHDRGGCDRRRDRVRQPFLPVRTPWRIFRRRQRFSWERSDTIVNNYGDDQGDSRFAQAADQDQNISPDIDDERDNSGDDFSGGDDGGGSSDVLIPAHRRLIRAARYQTISTFTTVTATLSSVK